MKALVTGAGGFIGGHLVKRLLSKGVAVKAVDIKPRNEWFQFFEGRDGATNLQLNLQSKLNCERALEGVDQVYNLAADMGGIGYIEGNKAACMLSVLINTHLLLASTAAEIKRYFYSSSACVYAADKQTTMDARALKENDAYPAMPEDGYGWEKLFSERMCRHFMEDFGLQTRVARFHNVYGPHGTWRGGREKAPAAICRKVIEVAGKQSPGINIWGDGNQTRSFMWIEDCLEGIERIMHSDIREPINLGSDESVSINQLVDIVEEIAGVKLKRSYDLSAPKGVNGRNSDNTMIQALLGWAPSTPLRDGIRKTYDWIEQEIIKA